jgi:Flp pilus assembly protein TadG
MKNRAAFRSERGQSLTEFALVLPLLMIVLFGIIQFGIVFNNYISLTDAVRSGARKAATSRSLPDPPGATIAQVRRAASDLKPADLEVTVESTWVPLEDVRVSASYPYKINLLGIVVASGRMTSTTIERVEQ